MPAGMNAPSVDRAKAARGSRDLESKIKMWTLYRQSLARKKKPIVQIFSAPGKSLRVVFGHASDKILSIKRQNFVIPKHICHLAHFCQIPVILNLLFHNMLLGKHENPICTEVWGCVELCKSYVSSATDQILGDFTNQFSL